MNESSKNVSKRLLNHVETKQGIEKLLAVMDALREPEGGCDWDLAQDYKSIIPFTIEEVYEVAEAIESEDFCELKNELGDLLFQVVFYARLAKEENRFNFNDVAEAVSLKLVRRHPHVFADENFEDETSLKAAWEEQKHKERLEKSSSNKSVLVDIPKALPELKRAQKIQKRAAKVGFDWDNVNQVWEKVEEESIEVKQAYTKLLSSESSDKSALQEEIGDLLFSVVNLSRHYGVDADSALRKASQKFEKRFYEVEQSADFDLSDKSLEELEALWQAAKKKVKS